ncbi:MAG TPA: c-type cytochrome [Bryobacteraceae bacterium]|nr:c-type cytochrome [Bryobacteraceae bacterium]
MTRFWMVMALTAGAAMAADAKLPAQAARGQVFFFDETAARHCGSCHALAHKGTAVGPDLTRLARLNARAIVMAIRATRTQYVVNVKLKDGTEFPGMAGAKDDAGAQYYDLSATPPALRKLASKDVAAVVDNATWKHPPESAGYTAPQLADVIAYIKWASYGDTKGVNPDEVE